MLQGAATFFEKLPAFSRQSGLILAVVGGALEAGLRLGLIDRTALSGYIAQGAPVLWIVGLAMLASSLLLALAPKVLAWAAFPARRRQKREFVERLRGNIRFLDHESQLILFLMLRMPQGRMPATGLPAFRRLLDLHLIREEREQLGMLVLPVGGPRGLVKVTPEIFELRATLGPELARVLTRHYGSDVSTEQELHRLVDEAHDRFGRNVSI